MKVGMQMKPFIILGLKIMEDVQVFLRKICLTDCDMFVRELVEGEEGLTAEVVFNRKERLTIEGKMSIFISKFTG
jgi:hypothetical protein